MPERVGGTGKLRCEQEVINMAGTWGAYNANPGHQCRSKAKYRWTSVSGAQTKLVCGTHANSLRRWTDGPLEKLP